MKKILFTDLNGSASNLTRDPSSNPLFTPGSISKQAATIFSSSRRDITWKKTPTSIIIKGKNYDYRWTWDWFTGAKRYNFIKRRKKKKDNDQQKKPRLGRGRWREQDEDDGVSRQHDWG